MKYHLLPADLRLTIARFVRVWSGVALMNLCPHMPHWSLMALVAWVGWCLIVSVAFPVIRECAEAIKKMEATTESLHEVKDRYHL